jgi:hypothetical protein
MIAYVVEQVFAHMPVAVHQQLAVVAFRQRIFGYPLVG